MLTEITIVLAVAILIIALGKRFGLPILLGYLLTGLVLGPSAFDVISSQTLVNTFHQYGAIGFMFLLGFMLRPKRLIHIRQSLLKFIGIKFAITSIILTILAWLFFQTSIISSIVIGLALALSSITFVIHQLEQNHLAHTQFGQNTILILMAQSIMALLVLVLLPILAGQHNAHNALGYFAAIVAICSGLYLFNRYLLQPFFVFLIKVGAKEILMTTALFIVIAVVLLMKTLEINIFLGAFLAGMILADSQFRQNFETYIEPFKAILIGLFFTSIGLSINIHLLMDDLLYIALGAVLLIAIKFCIILATAYYQKQKTLNGIKLGLLLGQGGEFAFIIFMVAATENILTSEHLPALNLMVIFSMIISTALYYLFEKILEPKLDTTQSKTAKRQEPTSSDHILIAGFGRFGQIIARIAHINQLSFKVIDNSIQDADFIENYEGQMIYANATDSHVLDDAKIAHASIFILAIDDIDDSMQIARYVCLHHPHLTILARARDRHHAYLLQELGVRYVWRETYHSAIHLAEHLLLHYGFSSDATKEQLENFKLHDEGLLKSQLATFEPSHQHIESDQSITTTLQNLFENDEIFIKEQSVWPTSKIKDTESTQMPDITP